MKVAPREGVTPRCAICHDDAADGPLLCPACQTVVHAECRVGLPCPTLGCPHGPRGPVRERVVVLRPTLGEVLVEAAASARRKVSLELLLAATLAFGLVSVVVVVNVLGQSHGPRIEPVRADMLAIGDAADLFRIARGYHATSVEPLVAQGFLRERPVDPWGEPYRLRWDGRTVEVLSAGPDRVFGSLDDLSSRTNDSWQR